MSEAAAVGRSVIKVRATDQDMGANAEITYKIISGDDQGNNVSRYVLLCPRKIFCRCCSEHEERIGYLRVLSFVKMISSPQCKMQSGYLKGKKTVTVEEEVTHPLLTS